MTANTCTVPGCTKPHKAHGFCETHYARWRKTGDPGGAESLRLPKPLPACSVPGCDSSARSSGVLHCEMHYARVRRHGTPDAARRYRRSDDACSVDGCNDPETDKGMCMKHATRMRRHGDPTVCILSEDRNLPHGPDNPAWVGDEVGYDGAHARTESAKGKASEHACADCGKPARHWSYDHADPAERTSGKGAYSADPDHYVPRCVSCHKIFDLSIKQVVV